jgi:hypothetical protein
MVKHAKQIQTISTPKKRVVSVVLQNEELKNVAEQNKY